MTPRWAEGNGRRREFEPFRCFWPRYFLTHMYLMFDPFQGIFTSFPPRRRPWWGGLEVWAHVLPCFPDIDECALSQDDCPGGTSCINTGGGFQCVNPQCPPPAGNVTYVKTSPL